MPNSGCAEEEDDVEGEVVAELVCGLLVETDSLDEEGLVVGEEVAVEPDVLSRPNSSWAGSALVCGVAVLEGGAEAVETRRALLRFCE